LKGLGFCVVIVFISYVELAEEQEGGVRPLLSVEEGGFVGLDHQTGSDYQWLAFVLRTQS